MSINILLGIIRLPYSVDLCRNDPCQGSIPCLRFFSFFQNEIVDCWGPMFTEKFTKETEITKSQEGPSGRASLLRHHSSTPWAVSLNLSGTLSGKRPRGPLCRSAWVGFLSQSICRSVCLFVRSITQKRMIPKCSNLVQGMNLGYTRSGTVLGFKGQRSTVKVTRLINSHTVNAQYLQNGKAYKVQTWYTDGTRRPVSATSAVTSKVKGKGHKVTWRVWQVLADKSRTKRPRNNKIGGKVTHPTDNNADKFQGQRPKVKVT